MDIGYPDSFFSVILQGKQQGSADIVSTEDFLALFAFDADGERLSGFFGQFFGCADESGRPAAEDGDAVAQSFYLGHVVTGQQDGFALRFQPAYLAVQRDSALYIQSGGWFVQKDDVRIAGQGEGKVKPAFLSSGQLSVQLCGKCSYAQSVQQIPVGPRPMPPGKQFCRLQRLDAGRQSGGLQLYPHFAADPDFSAVRTPEAFDTFQCCGFSGTVCSQQGKNFALPYGKGQFSQNGMTAVAFG